MENKTLTIFFILVAFIFSCKSTKNNLSNFNKYKPTNNSLLFRDSKGKLYFRVENINDSKIKTYHFINKLGLNDDTIIEIDSILDLKTFTKCEGTNIYFVDKNRVYSYGDDPARWPLFNELKLNRESFEIIDSLTIKDNYNKYYKGVYFYD